MMMFLLVVAVLQWTSTATLAAGEQNASAQTVLSSTPVGAQLSCHDKDKVVEAHNKFRSVLLSSDMHCVTWNEKLAVAAESWAKQCKRSYSPDETRSNATDLVVGENIFIGQRNTFNPVAVVQSWFDQKATCKDPADLACTAGYMQTMWAPVTEVGCAAITCNQVEGWTAGTDLINFVCQYNAAADYAVAQPFTPGPACQKCSCGSFAFPNLCCSANSISSVCLLNAVNVTAPQLQHPLKALQDDIQQSPMAFSAIGSQGNQSTPEASKSSIPNVIEAVHNSQKPVSLAQQVQLQNRGLTVALEELRAVERNTSMQQDDHINLEAQHQKHSKQQLANQVREQQLQQLQLPQQNQQRQYNQPQLLKAHQTDLSAPRKIETKLEQKIDQEHLQLSVDHNHTATVTVASTSAHHNHNQEERLSYGKAPKLLSKAPVETQQAQNDPSHSHSQSNVLPPHVAVDEAVKHLQETFERQSLKLKNHAAANVISVFHHSSVIQNHPLVEAFGNVPTPTPTAPALHNIDMHRAHELQRKLEITNAVPETIAVKQGTVFVSQLRNSEANSAVVIASTPAANESISMPTPKVSHESNAEAQCVLTTESAQAAKDANGVIPVTSQKTPEDNIGFFSHQAQQTVSEQKAVVEQKVVPSKEVSSQSSGSFTTVHNQAVNEQQIYSFPPVPQIPQSPTVLLSSHQSNSVGNQHDAHTSHPAPVPLPVEEPSTVVKDNATSMPVDRSTVPGVVKETHLPNEQQPHQTQQSEQLAEAVVYQQPPPMKAASKVQPKYIFRPVLKPVPVPLPIRRSQQNKQNLANKQTTDSVHQSPLQRHTNTDNHNFQQKNNVHSTLVAAGHMQQSPHAAEHSEHRSGSINSASGPQRQEFNPKGHVVSSNQGQSTAKLSLSPSPTLHQRQNSNTNGQVNSNNAVPKGHGTATKQATMSQNACADIAEEKQCSVIRTNNLCNTVANAKILCQKTCGFCNAAQLQQHASTCFDMLDSRQCTLANCLKSPGRFLELCPKTCNNCNGKVCYDTKVASVDCHNLQKLNLCPSKLAQEFCPKTCNNNCNIGGLASPTPNHPSPPTSNSCVDEPNFNCATIAPEHDCARYPGRYMVHCKKTCNNCDNSKCADLPISGNKKCDTLAKITQCKTTSVQEICPRSCGIC